MNELRYVRRRRIPAVVVVDDSTFVRTHLRALPQIGTRLDVGLMVIVTGVKEVAGGGAIITADRVGAPTVEEG